jgi:pSer/pThr/pTyr-binding forkhead associated (FHA) protein
MPKCPNPECGHDNVDGTQFCEMCGEELETPDSAGTSVAAGDTIFCPECNAANDAENVACEACGADLPGKNVAVPDEEEPVSTEPDIPAIDPAQEENLVNASAIPDNEPDAAPGPKLEPGQVKLSVEQGMVTGKQYVLGDAEMLVGREDEEEEIYPDIDLDDQDEGYVHRRHATLKFENGQLTVTHEGGANKTRINNKPIPDNQPMPLKLGDKVSFGKVVLRVLPNA